MIVSTLKPFFFLNFPQHQAQEEENAKEGGQQNKNNKQLKLSWRII